MVVPDLKIEVEKEKSRCLPFEGAVNFRDMGGYENKEGRRVKWGKLYRSGHLAELTDKDLAYFKTLNIRLVCDFRRKDEQDLEPNRLPQSGETQTVNVPIHTGSSQSFLENIQTGRTGRKDMMAVMHGIYTKYVNDHADAFAEMFRHILAAEDGAVLIHCTAGKDRTGFGSALILSALGVEKELVFQDYLLSLKCFPIERALERVVRKYTVPEVVRFDAEIMRPVYEVHPDYMNTAFDLIENQFGSVTGFLEKRLGVTEDMRGRLKDRYLA